MEDKLDKILSKVLDIEEKLSTDFVNKDEFHNRIDDVITMIDRFAKLHETLDQELVMLRAQHKRLEDRVLLVEQKVGLA